MNKFLVISQAGSWELATFEDLREEELTGGGCEKHFELLLRLSLLLGKTLQVKVKVCKLWMYSVRSCINVRTCETTPERFTKHHYFCWFQREFDYHSDPSNWFMIVEFYASWNGDDEHGNGDDDDSEMTKSWSLSFTISQMLMKQGHKTVHVSAKCPYYQLYIHKQPINSAITVIATDGLYEL